MGSGSGVGSYDVTGSGSYDAGVGAGAGSAGATSAARIIAGLTSISTPVRSASSVKQNRQSTPVSGLPHTFWPHTPQVNLTLLFGAFCPPGRCADCKINRQPVAASLS